MKKLFFFALAFAFAVAAKPVQAQGNLLKANLLSPLLQTGSFYFEHVIKGDKSLQLGVFFTKLDDLSGYGITPEYRVYLSDTPAPDGFYVAPFLGFMKFKVDNGNDGFGYKGKTTNFGGGLIAGRQWIFKQKVSFDIFLGPEYTVSNAKAEYGNKEDIEEAAYNGWLPRAGVALGFKF
ncbi:DUF3575 domain-containing protein [Nibribacter ruber]|uniref:DUF3575 domain-containing protein n=1 Tax=Nibribacter ruber TaxID=2698458 RepID=A0A6P1NWG5_9BACT|nr:DUF3575 domain-containing protein [Nibribacter ruber]QHL88186.1 DUF3575 domain-containing protein [Nibribacter ruber]